MIDGDDRVWVWREKRASVRTAKGGGDRQCSFSGVLHSITVAACEEPSRGLQGNNDYYL